MDSIISICNNKELFSSPTLQELCTCVCASNAKTVLIEPTKGGNGQVAKLRDSATLPVKIWEDILANHDRKSAEYFSLVTAINAKVSNGLRNLNFSGCTKLTDSDLGTFMRNCPYSLDIHNCSSLTEKAFGIINEFGKNLESLHIGNSSHILPTFITSWIVSAQMEDNPGLLQTPKLRRLIIWGLQVAQWHQLEVHVANPKEGGDNSPITLQLDYWEYLMREFIHKLEYLDLSSCEALARVRKLYLMKRLIKHVVISNAPKIKNQAVETGIRVAWYTRNSSETASVSLLSLALADLSFLLKAKDNLRTLRVHDVFFEIDDNERTWGVVRNLRKLTFLDVSQYSGQAPLIPNPDRVLKNIVTSLPNLSALDISGTNLAGPATPNSSKTGIKGLSSRVDNPLNFLGLLATHHDASSRSNIPALKVAGEGNVEQLVTALKHYLPQVNMSVRVLEILRKRLPPIGDDDFVPCRTLLRLLCQVMKIHIDDRLIMLGTTVTIIYVLGLIAFRKDVVLDNRAMNEVVRLITAIMAAYPNDSIILRNGLYIIRLMHGLEWKMDASTTEDFGETLLATGITLTKDVVGEARNREQTLVVVERTAISLFNILESGPIVIEIQLRKFQVMRLLCTLMTQLMKLKMVAHFPAFWLAMDKVVDGCHDPLRCDQFLQAGGVTICFNYIKMFASNDPIEGLTPDTDDLVRFQIPLIGILTNLLVYFPASEVQIIKSDRITDMLQVFDRSQPQGPLREFIVYATWGFLANVVLKKTSYSLTTPTRADILAKMSEVMSDMPNRVNLDTFPRDLTMMYGLLECQDVPMIQFWALKTLEAIVAGRPGIYPKMIAKDKRLTPEKLYELGRKITYEFGTDAQNLCMSLITKIIS